MRTPSPRRGGGTLGRPRRVAWLVAPAAAATLVLGTIGAALSPPASATSDLSMGSREFVVNTTADGHDAHPGDGRCADASGSVRCAVRSKRRTHSVRS